MKFLSHDRRNPPGNNSGIICDGAKARALLKIATAIDGGILGLSYISSCVENIHKNVGAAIKEEWLLLIRKFLLKIGDENTE